MIKRLIFDLDNTLITWEDTYYEFAVKNVCKYLHLANYLVANNTRVKTGQVIATMGDTNTDKGTRVGDFPRHLHQETWVKINGTSGMAVVNPWKTTSLKLLTQLIDYKKY